VAEGATHQEQLATLGDHLGVGLLLLRLRRREHGVQPTGEQEAEEQQDETCDGTTAMP
jgi:hypothetical protein